MSEWKPIVKTFRFRVKDRVAGKHLNTAACACNLVWNHCNAMQLHAIKHNQRWPNISAFQESTKGVSQEIGIPAQTVQQVFKEYERRRRMSRKRHLRWRGARSLGWVPFANQTVTVDSSVGAIRFNGRSIRLWMHRPIEGEVKSGNFAQDSRGRWYCNLVVECDINATQKKAECGIDLGLKNGMTLSTGEKIENCRMFSKYEHKLALAQRGKKRRRVQAIHAKISNARKDFLHKETTKIANQFGLICVGNVSGRWLQATNGKSSTDASTGMSRNMLRYKAIARGAIFVDTSEYLSSQTCSNCFLVGGPKGREGLSVREWACSNCGAVHDRDVNAACNILRLGRKTLKTGSPFIAAHQLDGKGATREKE